MNEISVMVSGGIDSLVAYHLAKTRFGKVTPVFVDVGQPYVEPERELCRKFYGDQLVEFSANMCNPTFGNLPTVLSQEIYGRNLMLALYGAIVSPNVWLAALETEMNQTAVADKRSEFFLAASSILTMIMHNKQKVTYVETPFSEFTKSDVVALGITLGLKDEIVASRSCYDPNHHSCGECSTCFKRWIAMVNNDLPLDQFHNPKPYLQPYARKIVGEMLILHKHGKHSERYSEKRISETFSALSKAGVDLSLFE